MLPLLMTLLCVILLLIAPEEARSYQDRVLDALKKHPSFWPHQNLPSQEFQRYRATQDYRQQFNPNPIFQSDEQSSRYLNNLYLPELLPASQQQPRYRGKSSKYDLQSQWSSKHRSSSSGVLKLVDKLKAKLPRLEAVAYNKRYPSKSSDKYKSVEIKVSNYDQPILYPISQRAKDVMPKQRAVDAVRWAEVLALLNNGQSASDVHDVDKAVLQLIAKEQANAFLKAEDLPNTEYEKNGKSTKLRVYEKLRPDRRSKKVCVPTVTCYSAKDETPNYTTYAYPYYYPYYYPTYYPSYYYYPYYGYYGRR